MEEIHCDILRKFHKAIIDDVDVNNEIIKPLRKENILDDENIKSILNGRTLKERASILLELLPQYVNFFFFKKIQKLIKFFYFN